MTSNHSLIERNCVWALRLPVDHGEFPLERWCRRSHRRRWHADGVEQSESIEPLPVPSAHVWRSVGLTPGEEIHAGYQSRVFIAERGGEKVVVKLSDSRLVDESFLQRIEIQSSLARIDESVVGPLTLGSSCVAHLDDWLAVAYPFVVGEAPDITSQSDVRHMAEALSRLHGSLKRLDIVDMPAVAALRGVDALEAADGFGPAQLLHGDFSDANTLMAEGGVRIFDLDDCGYGPVEFEIGNTLYMVLFDAVMNPDMHRYERFRAWFVDEYRSAGGRGVTDTALDRAIRLRVDALGRWIDRPETAPIGIRTATTEWRESLRVFVRSRLPPD